MKNLFMMFVAVFSFVMFSGSASAQVAAEKYTAEGVRMSSPSNSLNVTITPVSVSDFYSLALCEQFIVDQNALNLGTFKGYTWTSQVKAECSKSK